MSVTVVAAGLVGLVALAVFVVVELRSVASARTATAVRRPPVHRDQRGDAAGLRGDRAFFFLLVLYLQVVAGLSPLLAGAHCCRSPC